jgi:hypothetical protein
MIRGKPSGSKMPPARHKRLRVLMVTGAYPTERGLHKGTFIKSQVDSLIAAGVEVGVIHPRAGTSTTALSLDNCTGMAKGTYEAV